MSQVGAARRAETTADLFNQIGAFLAAHRLSADPAHYAFVYAILTDSDAAMASEVARLTDDGIRLTGDDIERLVGRVASAGALVRERGGYEDEAGRKAGRLVAQTQAQVGGFADMMRAIQVETRGFGLDLAQSAAAITRGDAASGTRDVARIAAAMIERVRDSEARLAQATDEADALRLELAEACETARRDPLTGLPNRLAFSEAFGTRNPRQAPHCLALCDIDRFKRINDEHGHGTGDRVLNAIGRALADACIGQLVARHGGEEFAVLLHGIALADAVALLDRARGIVAAKRFRDRESGALLGTITFSTGVTAIQHGEVLEQVIERADRLLYTAKAQGRDQVCAG